MLEVRSLALGGDAVALETITFSAGRGITLLMGGSRSVGRELLRALARLRDTKGGAFYWFGQEATRLSPLAVHEAGLCYIEGNGALMSDLTVDATIALGRTGSREERSSAIERVLAVFPDLADHRAAAAGALPADQAFTLSLARGLSSGAKFFLLDGVGEGADADGAARFVGSIIQLSRQEDVGILVSGRLAAAGGLSGQTLSLSTSRGTTSQS